MESVSLLSWALLNFPMCMQNYARFLMVQLSSAIQASIERPSFNDVKGTELILLNVIGSIQLASQEEPGANAQIAGMD